jgi:hypothetical protein
MASQQSHVPVQTLREHYWVMIGEICELARTGRLAVEVTTGDGRTLDGIPSPHPVNPDDAAQVDDTGFANDLAVNGEVVGLMDVVELRLRMPGG